MTKTRERLDEPTGVRRRTEGHGVTSEHNLPTTHDMFAHAADELDQARSAAERAKAWLQSNWRPAGTELTATETRAQVEVLKLCHQIKDLTERAGDAIGEALDG